MSIKELQQQTTVNVQEKANLIQLRYGHPLGQYVIKKALSEEISDSFVQFELDSYPYKVALLEQYKGKNGIACVYRVCSNNDYDGEEQLIACAQTNKGEMLPAQFVSKLLELEACAFEDDKIDDAEAVFKDEFEKQFLLYTDKLETKTNEYVDYEITKYEMWAEDQLIPLRKEVMDLSREHDALRRQIRKEHNASIKLQMKKEENMKGKLLSQKRAILFDMEDEYADKVDKMTDKLQLSMKNSTTSSVWFKFRWKLN